MPTLGIMADSFRRGSAGLKIPHFPRCHSPSPGPSPSLGLRSVAGWSPSRGLTSFAPGGGLTLRFIHLRSPSLALLEGARRRTRDGRSPTHATLPTLPAVVPAQCPPRRAAGLVLRARLPEEASGREAQGARTAGLTISLTRRPPVPRCPRRSLHEGRASGGATRRTARPSGRTTGPRRSRSP